MNYQTKVMRQAKKLKKLMKVKTYLNRIIAFGLIATVAISNVFCVKHVTLPMDASRVEREKTVYVTLKTGQEWEVKRPEFKEEYLIGSSVNKEITILLADIESIETVRLDVKKSLIVYTFSLATLTLLYIALVPTGMYFD